jgi:hypothetical protein
MDERTTHMNDQANATTPTADKGRGATNIEPPRMSKRKTNPFGRTVDQSTPYATYANDSGWTWIVVKTYQHPDNEDDYSRWLCYVSSPFTRGGYDHGDVYVSTVVNNTRLESATDEWIVAYGAL